MVCMSVSGMSVYCTHPSTQLKAVILKGCKPLLYAVLLIPYTIRVRVYYY